MSLNFPKIEEKILKFWEEKKIFDKLRKKNQGKEKWSFLDGPITANNPMGVHHAWGRTYKDLFQRYKALQGFDQRFQNGFDCQGLWVEVEVEKELGFKTKKDIEKYGMAKFVEKCKERVRKYSKIQTEQSIRLGQWMDWKNSYYTMSDENNYAIWNFLKKCWERGLLYKGRDSVPWCPRCGTAISQHEILQEEYRLLTHKTVILKFPIGKKEYLLAWTTTPWSIPGTIALMANPDFDYVRVKQKDGEYILAKERISILKGPFKIIEKFKGKKIIGKNFVHPYRDFPALKGQKFPVIPSKEFVTLDIGSGIVTNNPGVGHEDYLVAKEVGLLPIESVDGAANFLDGYSWISGKNAKGQELTDEILGDLEKRGFVYDIFDFNHSYPVCWRCKSELIFRLVNEWYIAMGPLRKPLMKTAKTIKWIPSFGRDRELDWLKNMQDWLISKKRYWGLSLPIYDCKCGHFEVIGSKEELKEKAVSGWKEFEGYSPHRPWIDKVKIKCSKCGKIVSRIPDVGNPWLDAGIVPFSTMKYFSDRKYWKEWFPVDLICESFPGQFKNWFYAIIVMSQVLENLAPMKTIFGYASVRDEKGEEMHKSKGNAIWFDDAVKIIGADPMRWMYARQNIIYNLRFGYRTAEEIKRKLLTLWNSFQFFKTYVEKIPNFIFQIPDSKNLLDQWIISRLQNLIEKVTRNLDKYNVAVATLAIENFFIQDLSLWYIRRSRSRFQKPKNEKEKQEAVATLYYLLLTLTKLLSPITPFLAEEIYLGLRTENMPESVHLSDWPKAVKEKIKPELEEKMKKIREIVSLALSERKSLEIKVRQPLRELKVKTTYLTTLPPEGRAPREKLKVEKELLNLIKDEVNVKKIVFDKKIKKEIKLDTKITPKLKEEGTLREVIRNLQEMRKIAGFKAKDIISIQFKGEKELNEILLKNKENILKSTIAKSLKFREKGKIKVEKEIEIDQCKLWLGINRANK